MGAGTHVFVALHANSLAKQHGEFKSPSQTHILVGDKAADKATDLSINHLFAQEAEPNAMKPSFDIMTPVRLSVIAAVCLLFSACQRKALPGNYDMVAASVTVKPVVVHMGDKVVLDHTVRNDGKDTVPGGTFYVDLYVDGKRVSFDHGTFDIGPGQKSEYGMAPGCHHWIPTKPGRYRYRLVVDEKNNLDETDEKNNILEGDIEVLP